MTVLNTLLPVVFLILLGGLLAKIRFLGPAFTNDLNKLAFWAALPALIFRSAVEAGVPRPATLVLFCLLAVSTLFICGLAIFLSRLLRVPPASSGAVAQAAFRGNLAYVGIPVLTYAATTAELQARLPDAVVTMTLLMVVYNALAVAVLVGSRQSPVKTVRDILTNPLLISGLLGLAWGSLQIPMPLAIDRTLSALGAASVPIALLCIGGTLSFRAAPGRNLAAGLAVTLKIVASPALVWLLAHLAHLGPEDTKYAVILAACPTAAASYVMAEKSGGDGPLTSLAIATSTILAAPVLFAVLWVFQSG
ncbi:MAG: AEC family transporter [Terrimicrobiaceae bacterium]